MPDLKSERKRLCGRNAAPPLWSQVDQPTQSTWFYHIINLILPANQAYFWREGPMKASRFHLRFTRLIFSWLWWRISWISSFTRLTLVSLQCIYKQYFPVKLHRKHLLGRQCFRFHGERSPILTDERVEDSFVRRICSFVLWKCYFFTLKCWFFTLKSAIQERIKGGKRTPEQRVQTRILHKRKDFIVLVFHRLYSGWRTACFMDSLRFIPILHKMTSCKV